MRNRSVLAVAGSTFLFAGGGAVTHVAAAGVGAGIGGTLPPSGTTFSLIEDGDMVMECNGVVHRFDLHGTGQLLVGDRVAGDTPTTVVTTETEQLTGYDADLGTVTVSERGPAAGEFVAPGVGREFPAAESFAQDVTVAMDHSPCDNGQPAVYASRSAFSLLNTDLNSFPPKNAVYLLAEPVELVDVTHPSAASFTLTSFPVTVTQAP
ncbi:MAG: hypothetical protein ACJ786_17525 [Catenulispora sp.]